MRMTWSELLFAHWRVDPSLVARWLPPGVTLDTQAGDAWVAVVPFLMSDVAPRWFPSLPKLSYFPELNVRTYVTVDGKPGVWFFSLDAASRLAVRTARILFHLPYMDARMAVRLADSMTVHYDSERSQSNEPPARFAASYSALGEVFEAQPGTLEHWLTARYCLYSADRKGTIFCGEVNHAPWQLSMATWDLKQNTMGEPWGFDLSGQPHLMFAQPVKVQAWKLERCN
jgi:uncharacterized protein YqjF (DUF2071 family)